MMQDEVEERDGSDMEMNVTEKRLRNDFLNPLNEVENMNGSQTSSKLTTF